MVWAHFRNVVNWKKQQGAKKVIRGLENTAYNEGSKELQLFYLQMGRLRRSRATIFKGKE